MALTITDCKATTSSITVFFSEAVTGATFTVYDPIVAPNPLSVSSPVFSGNEVTFNTPQTLNAGDQILLSATAIVVTGYGTVPGPVTVAAVVNGKHALRIANCIATPTTVIISFSQPLDPDPDPTKANYTVSQPAGGTFPFTPPPLYDAFNKAIILQFPPASPLPRGKWVVVTVSGVNAGGVAIANGGNDTFSTRVNGDGGDEGRKKQAKEVTESVEDAVAYPLLTEQVSFPPSGGAVAPTTVVTPAPAGGAALGQTVARAVSDVLGWKANAADPKGFIGSLTQAFTLTRVEGHTEATWNPRTYAVQTDLGGGITGAQASLYTRAKDALDQSLPLLDGLYPLDPDADPEYVKALREMARSQMNAIVTELGTLGGPSILRVNTYFSILLGPQTITFAPGNAPTTFDPDQIQGTLGELRDTYGIYFQKDSQNNPFSNSIEDEQDITNFRVISDYMTSLLQTWISNGQFFVLGSPTQPTFFGTQLVLISRQFNVIAETVNEVRFALDSVFIGPSERQTLLLQFRNNQFPAIFLEDMLQEIEAFVSDEGPGLLQNGGRISVTNNILPVVSSFQGMVGEARRPVNLRSLPDGYRTVRVQRALDDLRDQISELINLVQPVGQQLPAPVQVPEPLQVLFVSPNTITGPGTVTLTIVGTGFEQGATCNFTPTAVQPVVAAGGTLPTISLVGAPFVTENLLFAQVATSGGTTGTRYTYNVSVTNPDGTSAFLQSGQLTVIGG